MRVQWITRIGVACAAAMLLVAPVVAAQDSHITDVGSFSLLRNGERVGREQFSIRQRPGPDGRAAELRAETAIGTRRAAYRLEVDSLGSPLRYAVEIRTGPDISLRLGGQRVRGRFTTLSKGDRGEAAREYLLGDGVHVLDDDVIHQYAALVEGRQSLVAGEGVDLPVLAPLANRQSSVRLVLEARDDVITIAGVLRTASRWRVAASSGDHRLLWTDADGRLLRLLIPAQGFEALRDDLPRPGAHTGNASRHPVDQPGM